MLFKTLDDCFLKPRLHCLTISEMGVPETNPRFLAARPIDSINPV